MAISSIWPSITAYNYYIYFVPLSSPTKVALLVRAQRGTAAARVLALAVTRRREVFQEMAERGQNKVSTLSCSREPMNS